MQWLNWVVDSRQYMPHGHCHLWQPTVLWMHVGSDVVMALAYFAIPAIIWSYWAQRRETSAFEWIPLLFGAFILLCGLTHVFGAWTAWHPDYRLAGAIKALTAVVSAGAAVSLFHVMPRVLALRTPAQLEAEVRLRTRELAEANHQLEMRQPRAGQAKRYCSAVRRHCSRPTVGRTSFWPRWRTSFGTHSHRSAAASPCSRFRT